MSGKRVKALVAALACWSHDVSRSRRTIRGGTRDLLPSTATLVTAHSDKEQAARTFKRGFGFHPLWAFLDHGAEGTGESLSCLLRKGNAGSNTAADHIAVVRDVLTQLPDTNRGPVRGARS